MNYRNMTNDELLNAAKHETSLRTVVDSRLVGALATRLEAAEDALDAARADVAEAEEEAASVERDANWFSGLVEEILPFLDGFTDCDDNGPLIRSWIERAEARL